MRYFFFIILSLFLISVLSFFTVNTITGNIVNTPNCGAAHTYAFYRTLEEQQAVEIMWNRAGFIPVSYEVAPDSFHASGRTYFMCLRRMNSQELEQYHMLERDRVVTSYGSV